MPPSALHNSRTFLALQIETKIDFKAQQIRERSKIISENDGKTKSLWDFRSSSKIIQTNKLVSYKWLFFRLRRVFVAVDGLLSHCGKRGLLPRGVQTSHCSGFSGLWALVVSLPGF